MDCLMSVSPACISLVLTMFLLSSLHIGTVKVIGVLVSDMSNSLQTTSAEMGIEIGLIIAFYFLTAPVIGVVNTRWNQIRLFLLIGAMLKSCAVVLMAFVTTNAVAFILFALMGIGTSIMWMTCLKELNRLAGENFKLLYSLSTCGYPVGMTLVPLLATGLLDVYSWRDVLLFLGALTTHLIPCGMTIKASMDPRDHAQYDGGDGRSQSDITSEMGLYQRVHGSEDRFDQDSVPRLDNDNNDSENGDTHKEVHQHDQCSQTKQDLTRRDLKITPIDDDDHDDEPSTKCSNLQRLIADCLSSYDATFKILAIVDMLTFIFMAVPKIFGRNLSTGKV
ncbi:monocarboxylate transporter 11-like isoform X2 [Lytechinus variegatus]|uniref:monocarboxylate transporter 11-like isoform X2 n=1 Tax=Lytechinus variegatus TaxID=7654 RepID=UPI001BB0FEE9|nr:monocarboxylate transporter 11-like isoform X2 [Lytechinus variegatus]